VENVRTVKITKELLLMEEAAEDQFVRKIKFYSSMVLVKTAHHL